MFVFKKAFLIPNIYIGIQKKRQKGISVSRNLVLSTFDYFVITVENFLLFAPDFFCRKKFLKV